MRLKRYAAVGAAMALGGVFAGVPAASADPTVFPGCHGQSNIAQIAQFFGGLGNIPLLPPDELGEFQQELTALCNPEP